MEPRSVDGEDGYLAILVRDGWMVPNRFVAPPLRTNANLRRGTVRCEVREVVDGSERWTCAPPRVPINAFAYFGDYAAVFPRDFDGGTLAPGATYEVRWTVDGDEVARGTFLWSDGR